MKKMKFDDPVKQEQALAENAVKLQPEVNLNLKYRFENYIKSTYFKRGSVK